MAVLLWGMAGLPAVGSYNGVYGNAIVGLATPERSAQNVVSAINFDYRGLDTLGEEYILFAAVAGTALLLRRLRREREGGDDPNLDRFPENKASDALRLWG